MSTLQTLSIPASSDMKTCAEGRRHRSVSSLGSQQKRSSKGPLRASVSAEQEAGEEGGEVYQGVRIRQEQYRGPSDQAELCGINGQHGQTRAMLRSLHCSRTPPCLLHSKETLMSFAPWSLMKYPERLV